MFRAGKGEHVICVKASLGVVRTLDCGGARMEARIQVRGPQQEDKRDVWLGW